MPEELFLGEIGSFLGAQSGELERIGRDALLEKEEFLRRARRSGRISKVSRTPLSIDHREIIVDPKEPIEA